MRSVCTDRDGYPPVGGCRPTRWLAGATPAQAQSWPGVGKRLMSAPFSATITSAVVLEIPGIEVRLATAAPKGGEPGGHLLGEGGDRRSRKSMWSMICRQATAWWCPKWPESASSSWAIFARILTFSI
jgi:hypothetical protein